jgi:arabinofuranosyltransferase
MDSTRSYEFIQRHRIALLAALIGALLLLAWSHRFLQDDAFISFRYARNFVRGYGLVWNPGERVEGFSNFFWTLLVTAGMWMGLDPVAWSEGVGLLSFAISLYFTFRLASECLGSHPGALLTVLLLGWNFTFHSFATGGLETQFQTCLFLLLITLLVRMDYGKRPTAGNLAAFSVVAAMTIMTRIDSIIVCGILEGCLLYWLILSMPRTGKIFFLALILPQSVILLPWLAWKLSYYGELFPNPFFLRTTESIGETIQRGVRYIDVFVVSYWLIPVCLVGVAAVGRFFRTPNRHLLLLAIILLAWILYLVFVGGGFMEFRLLVPVMPYMFILITWLLIGYIRSTTVRLVLVVLILAGSVYHEVTFTYNLKDGIEPVDQLYGHLVRPDEDWIGIGRMLDSLFAGDRSVTIATTAAGAIPFYSDLPAVDMLGVNDRWVVEHGVSIGAMAGHQVIAPASYLYRRQVNLVLSHPLVLPRREQVRYLLLLPIDVKVSMDSIRVLELPLGSKYKVIAWYLVRKPSIDSLIAGGDVPTYPVSRIVEYAGER